MRSASSAYRISFTCTLIELLSVIFSCSSFFSGSYIIFLHIVIHWLKVFFPSFNYTQYIFIYTTHYLNTIKKCEVWNTTKKEWFKWCTFMYRIVMDCSFVVFCVVFSRYCTVCKMQLIIQYICYFLK